MTATFAENILVEQALFKDCASTSHCLLGHFTGASEAEVCMLRGLQTIELYATADAKLSLLSEYKMPNQRVTSMVKFRGPSIAVGQDLLCVHLTTLKFVVLVYCVGTREWKTVCLFNFDLLDELKVSGKRFAKSGFLRSSQAGFMFLADDTIVAQARFSEQPKGKNVILRDENTHVVAGNALTEQLTDVLEPLMHFQLKDFGICHVIDFETISTSENQSTWIVLHLSDVDKLIGTKARYPVCKVTTFCQTGDKLEKLMTISNLNQYCRSIVVAANFFYIVSPVSLFLIRSDKNWVSEIQTSPLDQVLKDNFANDLHKTFTGQPDQPATVKRTVLNYSSAGLKLDQSRVIALQSNILLVNSIQGDFFTVQFKFDQALIDIAEVII